MKKLRSSSAASLIWGIFFSTLSHTTYAQVEKDTLLASQYFKKADSLSFNVEYKESIKFFKNAVTIYQKTESWEKVACCYNKISNIQRAYF